MAQATVIHGLVGVADLLIAEVGADTQELPVKNVVARDEQFSGFHVSRTPSRFRHWDRVQAASAVIVGYAQVELPEDSWLGEYTDRVLLPPPFTGRAGQSRFLLKGRLGQTPS